MSRPTARAIVVHEDKILLIERWRDGLHYFSIPGGGIEPEETAEAAAVRELQEETSITVKLERVVYVVQTPRGLHTIFLARYISGTPQLHSDSEEAQANEGGLNRFLPQWLPISSLAEVSLGYWQPLHDQLLRDIKNGFSDKPVDITYPDSVQ